MDSQYQTLRATTTTRALSTLGECPKWDAAVQDFLRCLALSKASEEFGPLAKASNSMSLAEIKLEGQFGRNWRENDEAKALRDVAMNALRKAEDAQSDDYYVPMWAAGRKIALTTPPTLNAALFKAELLEIDEIWNDAKLGRDAFDIVVEDMARFAGEAA